MQGRPLVLVLVLVLVLALALVLVLAPVLQPWSWSRRYQPL